MVVALIKGLDNVHSKAVKSLNASDVQLPSADEMGQQFDTVEFSDKDQSFSSNANKNDLKKTLLFFGGMSAIIGFCLDLLSKKVKLNKYIPPAAEIIGAISLAASFFVKGKDK